MKYIAIATTAKTGNSTVAIVFTAVLVEYQVVFASVTIDTGSMIAVTKRPIEIPITFSTRVSGIVLKTRSGHI